MLAVGRRNGPGVTPPTSPAVASSGLAISTAGRRLPSLDFRRRRRYSISIDVSSAPEILAKGLNFRGFLRGVERLYDKPTAERVIEAVAIAEARDALRYGHVVPGGWYPVAWHRALHAAAQSVTHGGRDLARRLGYEGTREDLGTVYRVIGGLLGPQTLIRLGNRLWSSYWQGGIVDTVEHGPGHVRTSFQACYGFDRNLWEDIAGSCMAVLEVAGAKEIHVRALEGGGDDCPNMVLDGRWQV